MQTNLNQLLELIKELPAYRKLLDRLSQGENRTSASLLDAARPYLIAALYRHLGSPVLLVTAQPERARKLYEQLVTWCPASGIFLFTEPDALPYQRITSDTATEMGRIQVLWSLCGKDTTSGPPLVVASAPALMQKTTRFDIFTGAVRDVKLGMNIEPFELLGRWQATGYTLENMVEVPGTISHRGGIIDIYPVNSELPVRIEFFGNTVDSIRLFDPVNQRSLKPVPSVIASPATALLASLLSGSEELTQILVGLNLSCLKPETREQFSQDIALMQSRQTPDAGLFYAPLFNHDSLLNYLPRDTRIILDEPENIKVAIADLDKEAEEIRSEKIAGGELPPNFPRPYFNWSELEPSLETQPKLHITSWQVPDSEPLYSLGFTPAAIYAGQLVSFIKSIRPMLDRRQRIVILSHQADRLSELLDEEDVIAPVRSEINEIPPPGALMLVKGSLPEGWVMNDNTHLFTDAEIFGFVKQSRAGRKRPVASHKTVAEITPGEYVVHVEHGIGRFSGVTTMRTNHTEKEYLVLQYAGSDRLYVPSDQIDRIERYIGASEQPPALSHLGSQEWTRTKQRVNESALDIAQDLIELYAARQLVPGFAFSQDTVWQQEMEAAFPYVETPDQIVVQRAVKEDMEKAGPMDRLVCGDVGYGKTEVAIRAAFKAVVENKQVAVLVPTTVLADQHFITFSERLNAFPVKVSVLSRFRTPKEQQAILDGLANGSVDICIGTHRLLQKDVVFKDLGLIIIDEEQRFGVTHKESLKKLRHEVDVLTLSATPIPRTLHMALVGVRDMSTMETPPEQRLPVKTFVAAYDDHLIRETVLRELERNGQVFFVHNRVQSIAYMANKLQHLVPEASIVIGHGQMPEAELERVMTDFTQGKSDVLVCTTIIESGLDLPNVNTLIVNDADRFGLTQLYQLRGRVGRGTNLAYGYFLYDKETILSTTAEKRLRTIFEATELGSGYNIAIKDLEIRGAGTLLGVKQSGHISAVGFGLYTRLLAEAVAGQKAKRNGEPELAASLARLPASTVDLPLAAHIPEDYIPDLDTRLSLYQRLTRIDSVEEIDTLAYDFKDRFGKLPPEVNNLLYAVKIKTLATSARVESVSTEDSHIIIRRFQGMCFNKSRLAPLVRYGIKISLTQIRLGIKQLRGEWQRTLIDVLGSIE